MLPKWSACVRYILDFEKFVFHRIKESLPNVPIMKILRLLLSLSSFLFCLTASAAKPDRPHILFIAVDDLRPELGCYGISKAISPNIDRLAASGTLFREAYCQVPVCGASRASLMTGLYPTRQRFLSYHTKADEEVRGIYDLPGWLKKNGYTTISNGKIYHQRDDFKGSWDKINHPGTFRRYALRKNAGLPKKEQPPFEKANVPDEAYPDGEIAEKVISDLRRAKASGSPFFITAGFTKPHLPFNAPAKYWNLYSRETFSLPDNYYPPKGVPSKAMHQWNELRGQYGGVPKKGPLSDSLALELIHGYYACVSYVDAMIGKVLDALDRLEMSEETIVILWGDHGWQLGEHSLWCKHALFKTSLNAPLILRAPGYSGRQVSDAIVEFVDIYPTLCELAGLELPTHLQGRSMVSLLENPEADFKMAAFSRYQRGEAVKTRNINYAEWAGGGQMLYDHRIDPDENINQVNNPRYTAVTKKLAGLLKDHRQKVREADTAYAASASGSEILSQNQPPVWSSETFTQKAAQVGQSYSTYIRFRASDPEEDGLKYAKLSGPEWIRLTNPRYGRFEGVPTPGDVGMQILKVSVSDGVNDPVEATMRVRVEAAP